MQRKVWDEITYPFLNFSGATVEVYGATVEIYEWKSSFIPHFIMDFYCNIRVQRIRSLHCSG